MDPEHDWLEVPRCDGVLWEIWRVDIQEKTVLGTIADLGARRPICQGSDGTRATVHIGVRPSFERVRIGDTDETEGEVVTSATEHG